MAPDHSGNVKLSCQFAEIHEDSTIWWTKDSKSIAQVERRWDTCLSRLFTLTVCLLLSVAFRKNNKRNER